MKQKYVTVTKLQKLNDKNVKHVNQNQSTKVKELLLNQYKVRWIVRNCFPAQIVHLPIGKEIPRIPHSPSMGKKIKMIWSKNHF